MTVWTKDKQWSDRFLPEIKKILGENLIGEPPKEEDAERNTDLIVLKMDAVRIACRVRRPCYRKNAEWAHQFTIRCSRPSGADTELTKIITRWGDYFLYGFSDEEEKYLSQWVLLSLDKFRLWLMRYMYAHAGRLPGIEIPNRDDSSTFRAFEVSELREFGGVVNEMGFTVSEKEICRTA